MANAVSYKPQRSPFAPYVNGLPENIVSPEQYLVQERLALDKHEYINGRVREMSAASRVHSITIGNIVTELNIALRSRADCEVYHCNMRVFIPATNRYTYPDVVAVIGEEPSFTDDVFDTVRNPTLIVEVLSPSTEEYDRNEKFGHYKTVPSLREYALVSQSECVVTVFVRDAVGGWQRNAVSGRENGVTLNSLRVTVALADLCRRVTTANEPPTGFTRSAVRLLFVAEDALLHGAAAVGDKPAQCVE